MRTFQ